MKKAGRVKTCYEIIPLMEVATMVYLNNNIFLKKYIQVSEIIWA
jgi:hypothetical protein